LFTGIVEGTGTVQAAARRGDVMAVRIDVGGLFAGLPLGGSIAVNGCCLTAVRSDARGFDVELTEETLRRTRFEERLVPGALGNEASSKQESFSSLRAAKPAGEPDATCASGGLLDYPHYTRPAEFRGLPVPEVLVQGDHEAIRKWRRRRALEKTLRNRPDLLTGVALSEEDKDLLADLRAAGGRAGL